MYYVFLSIIHIQKGTSHHLRSISPLHIPPVHRAKTSLSLPRQPGPPLAGSGAVQARLRVWLQSGPQVDHGDQGDHEPDTAGQKEGDHRANDYGGNRIVGFCFKNRKRKSMP